MYPALRALKAMVSGRAAPRRSLLDEHVSYHRVWPWDADMYLELNHGRTLTLFELGRWRLVTQTRHFSAIRRQAIGFAVAGVSIRYRRRLPVMARFRMLTRIVGWDQRFLYVVQSMWRGDDCANQVLVRAALRSRGRTVPPAEFLGAQGLDPSSPELPEWVAAWIEAEAKRPWPPDHLSRGGSE